MKVNCTTIANRNAERLLPLVHQMTFHVKLNIYGEVIESGPKWARINEDEPGFANIFKPKHKRAFTFGEKHTLDLQQEQTLRTTLILLNLRVNLSTLIALSRKHNACEDKVQELLDEVEEIKKTLGDLDEFTLPRAPKQPSLCFSSLDVADPVEPKIIEEDFDEYIQKEKQKSSKRRLQNKRRKQQHKKSTSNEIGVQN